MTDIDRFYSKVSRNGECLIFNSKYDIHGYRQFWFNGENVLVHRYIYEHVFGKIPKNMHIHHTCEVRDCVNILHLEMVKDSEHFKKDSNNIMKSFMLQTHCKREHEFTKENTYISKLGARCCRKCRSEYMKRQRLITTNMDLD